MAVLQPLLTDDNCLTPQGLVATAKENTAPFDALERVLKGVETALPDGMVMVDKEGTERKRVRVCWWLDGLNKRRLYEVARAPASALAQIPKEVLAESIDFA
ncbi:calcineurin-like phosphoesterase [Psychrobacter sp. JCM 18903]|nr:calcineurin-like phosphoesterase [Psychrobacter sp. JCM 18903]